MLTVDERNCILETVDILRTLGGSNGFTNLQPKVKRMLLGYANNLKAIVERDIRSADHSADKQDMEMTY